MTRVRALWRRYDRRTWLLWAIGAVALAAVPVALADPALWALVLDPELVAALVLGTTAVLGGTMRQLLSRPRRGIAATSTHEDQEPALGSPRGRALGARANVADGAWGGIELVSDAEVLERDGDDGLTGVRLAPPWRAPYGRVEVTDRRGRRAWTNPLWLDPPR